ncbi:MAG: radical SAM protein [Pseudomonadota bacterium]
MPLDVLFIQPPFWGTTTPPLGLASLKAVANEVGLETKCLDLNIELYQFAGRRYRKYWRLAEGYNHCENQKDVLDFYRDFYFFIMTYRKRIAEWKPKEIWITVQNSSSLFTSLLVKELKGVADIYLGGPQIWEFEQEGIEVKKSFSEIKGFYSAEGESLLSSKYDLVKLDKLPFPDYSDFDLRKYDYSGSLPLWFSRGCINKCIFCSERGLHEGFYRNRSGARVFGEVVYQLSQHSKVFFFHFHDSVSNGNIKELNNFCDLMIKSGLGSRVKWSMGNATIRKEMHYPLYNKMRDAGCTFIGYGLETPVLRLLKSIGKNSADGTDIPDIVKEAWAAGIKVNLNFMFGLPGETEQDFEETLQFLRDNRDFIYQINPALNLCGFFPGSEGYSHPEKYGIELGETPLLWSTRDNNYSIRESRFLRFVREARRLGIKNLFGDVERPVQPNKTKLYYRAKINLLGAENQSILWFVGRLWSNLWFSLIRNMKGRMRKWSYLRTGRIF